MTNIKSKKISGVLAKNDGSAIGFQFIDENNKNYTIEIPSHDAQNLMQLFLAATNGMKTDKTKSITDGKSFPVTRYEIGQSFPEGIYLKLKTALWGSMGFALGEDTAKKIAHDLQVSILRLQEDQSNHH